AVRHGDIAQAPVPVTVIGIPHHDLVLSAEHGYDGAAAVVAGDHVRADPYGARSKLPPGPVVAGALVGNLHSAIDHSNATAGGGGFLFENDGLLGLRHWGLGGKENGSE